MPSKFYCSYSGLLQVIDDKRYTCIQIDVHYYIAGFPQSNAGYGLPPPYSNPSVAGTSTQSNRGVHNGQDHRVPPTATADPHIITITDSDSYM